MNARITNDAMGEVITVETREYNLTKAFDLACDKAKEDFENNRQDNFDDYSTIYGFKLSHVKTSLVSSGYGEEKCFEYEFVVTDKK